MGGHSDSVKGFKSPHPYEAVDAAGAALVPRGTVGEGSSGGGRVAVLSKTPTLCLFDVQVGTPAGQATKQKQPSLVVFSGGTAFNSVAGGRNHASAFTGGSCVSNFHHLLNICRSPHASHCQAGPMIISMMYASLVCQYANACQRSRQQQH